MNEPPEKRTTGPSGRSPDPRILQKGPSDPAVAALRMVDLTTWVVERVGAMPKAHKFTVGDRLVQTCLDASTLLTEASYVRDKLDLLARASRDLVQGRILVEIAQRLGLLSPAQRKHFNEQSLEIGRMIGGWTKAVQMR